MATDRMVINEHSSDPLLHYAASELRAHLVGPACSNAALAAETIHVQRRMREIRIDLARLSDELFNITKFFGDWHLARIYQALNLRFHLLDWKRTVDEKLKTLDDLYQLLQADRNNRLMLLLELTIVVLFIIDLVILAMGLK